MENNESREKITPALLKSWSPCSDGYRRFCELFPDGADLQTAMDGLIADSHDDWAYWLFCACRERNLFDDIVCRGYRNSGHWNSGDWNSGDRNSGYQNSGNQNSGDRNSGNQNSGHWNSGNQNSGYRNSGNRNSGNQNSGYRNSGNQNSGDRNSGNRNSGDWNSGNQNSGYRNSGYQNSGDRNSGYQNSGNQNSGDRNSGYRNSGYQNSGDRNSGYQNSGNQNSGDRNSGDWNSGDWNSGYLNSGYFNSITPDVLLVFNKICSRDAWNMAQKPDFLFFSLTEWIEESAMTEDEKQANPSYSDIGGYLRVMEYKEAWKQSWDNADPENRELVRKLPNFNAEVFFEITGIDLRGK